VIVDPLFALVVIEVGEPEDVEMLVYGPPEDAASFRVNVLG